MVNVGDHARCPQCGGKARVVWVSQDRETIAIKCMGYHSHGEKGPSAKGSSYYKNEPKRKFGKGMVFLIERARMKDPLFT